MFRVYLLIGSIAACGTPPQAATGVELRLEYRASTTLPEASAGCVSLVGETHAHPSWMRFARVGLSAEGSALWTRTFSNVAPGSHRIRISDPNACDEHPTGAVERKLVYMNGVRLTRSVETPGDEGSSEPGFSFFLHEDGTVDP